MKLYICQQMKRINIVISQASEPIDEEGKFVNDKFVYVIEQTFNG